jgi:lipoate-protein ligase A
MNPSTNPDPPKPTPNAHLAGPLTLWDISHETPAENLALDEAMLEARARAEIGDTLRFWESPALFVVLGAGGRVADDVQVAACERDGVPILRRCSGGGTVLQGPGCLNFALSLATDSHPSLVGIDSTNAWVLSSVARALAPLLPDAPIMMGTSDLVFRGLKVGGNAQKRKKNAILFHGTILHGMDLSLVSHYLAEPPKQPEYREQRHHGEFVTNLPVTSQQIRVALAHAFSASPAQAQMALPEIVAERAESLTRGRYSDRYWHFAL